MSWRYMTPICLSSDGTINRQMVVPSHLVVCSSENIEETEDFLGVQTGEGGGTDLTEAEAMGE